VTALFGAGDRVGILIAAEGCGLRVLP